MHPIIFQFGPIKFYSYGLAVALGFILATLLAQRQARKQNIPPEKILNLCLSMMVSGILGARILYVLQNLPFYIQHPEQILMLHQGGLSFYGGFILATICAIIFLKRNRLAILGALDLLVPYLALAQAIGRIGCFLNGCCYGKAATSGLLVYFPQEAIGRYPVQIYSSLNLLLIFIILRIFQARARRKFSQPGRVFLLYCLLYSFSRFFMEYLRGDNIRIVANLTIHQLISAGIFIISWLFWSKNRSLTPH